MKFVPTLAIQPLSAVSTAFAFCRANEALWATVITKATFQLVGGHDAKMVAPSEVVERDQFTSQGGSLVAARETAPYLPRAGVILTGHAVSPGAHAVPSMSVRLGVSRDTPLVDKTLHVFGDRNIAAPHSPRPFLRMPLVYERAFGGPGVWENPIGKGGAQAAELANLVDPKDPRKVACFGPISPRWMPRRGFLGGVDPSLLEEPVWDESKGFDGRFFQPAPMDQQVDRLRGDEWIVLDGMVSGAERIQSRLPQVMGVARKRVAGKSGEEPIELRLDMLVIDADVLLVSAVWRGRFLVESTEVLGRTNVLVGVEQPGKAVPWPAQTSSVAAAVALGPTPKAKDSAIGTQEVDLSALFGAATPFAKTLRSDSTAPSSAGPIPRSPAETSASPASKGVSAFTGTTNVDFGKVFQKLTRSR